MKVVILAGGFGTRISEYTDNIPKPMVKIGNKPIIWHIMSHYAKFGHKEFIIALGYKSDVVKEYFANYMNFSSDFTVDFNTKKITYHSNSEIDWKVTLIDTGLNTMTGGRLKRLEDHLKDETFLLTYGDGLSNVNIDKLITHHIEKSKYITVTAVRPSARFGELNIADDSLVSSFKEKPQMEQGWINGGFFVVEPEFLQYINNDGTVLEKEPLEIATAKSQLVSYKHDGFWQCMDTKRDCDLLNEMWNSKEASWLTTHR